MIRDESGLEILRGLLQERPACMPGVKSIVWAVDLKSTHTYLQEGGTFEVFCKWAASNLQLDSLKIVLSPQESDRDAVSRGVGQFSAISACRLIPVKDTFDIRMAWSSDGSVFEDDVLSAKYSPLLREIMEPDSLRPQITVPTREESYMSQRLQPLPATYTKSQD